MTSRRGSLAVELTTRCDLACGHCSAPWSSDPAYPREELPAAALVALIVETLRAAGLGQVQLSGGEPLLRTDLLEIVAGLRAASAQVSLLTGGAGIDAALARRLAALRVGPVQPTLLAAERTLHDRLRGGVCFDDTLAGLERLLAAGVPVTVAYVCTRQNHEQFRDVVELCYALGVRRIAFSRLCLAGRAVARREALLPDAGMVAAALAVAEQANARLGMQIGVAVTVPECLAPRTAYPHLPRGRCALLCDSPGYTIDPSGGLRACSISPTRLGDLRREPWAALAARARLGLLRAAACPPAGCAACPSLAACGGGCRESGRAAAGGSWDGADPLASPRG